MNNSIAVLIPTKNRRYLLEKALQSVFNQSTTPEEIIVVNDGSTDDTGVFLLDLSKKYSNLRVVTRNESGGVNTARNQGIKLAESEWVAFLDDDDELKKNAVSIMKEKIGVIRDDFYLICFNTLIVNDKEEFIGGFQFKDSSDFFDPTYEEFMTKYNLKGDCKPVFRKTVFSTGNYWFEESVNGFESITIRKMIRDNKMIRYYKHVSTVINQKSDIEHLSTSAPLKNPKAYLDIHKKDLQDNFDFYNNNRVILLKKYFHMSRIAQRASLYKDSYRYAFLAFGLWLGKLKHYSARILGHLRWVRLGIRYRIILPIKYIGYNFSVPFFGYRYIGNLNDHIDRQVYYFGAYEFEELSFFKRYLDKESMVLDIGANTGHHSLFFSAHSKKVYSFEPFDKMFHLLENRIRDNDIKNIKAFNFGLGDTNQALDFFAPNGKNNGIGSFIRSEFGENIGKLEIKKGDDVVTSLNLERIDFVKIDVEGMEVSVIKGLLDTINKFKPVMFIEMSPESQATLDTNLKAKLATYKFYIIEANNPFLYFFNKPTCLLKDFFPQKETKNILCIPSN